MKLQRDLIYLYTYILVFLVLFPLATWYMIDESGSTSRSLLDPTSLILGGLIVVFSAVRLISVSRFCPEKMTIISFYIFCYIWLGLTPIYQLGIGQMPWNILLAVEIYHLTYLVIILAILSFEVGYQLTRKTRSKKLAIQISIGRKRIVIFSLLALISALWFGPLTQPLLVLVSFREEVAVAIGDDTFSLVRIALMRTPIYVALLLLIWKLRTDSRRDLLLIGILCLVLPVFLIVNFPTAVSRAWLGAISISTMLVFFLTSNRLGNRYFPLVLPIALLTVFPFMQRFRRAEYDADTSLAQSVLSTYSRGDFDVFSMTSHFVNYLDSSLNSVTYGHQLLGALFFWVPRSIWLDKPVGSGYFVAEKSGFGFYNVSAPFWAEGLINFGPLGVFLFMAILGVLLRLLDSQVNLSKLPSIYNLIYVYVSGFLFLILRGDLNTVMGFSVPFIMCAIFVGVRGGKASRSKISKSSINS